MEYTRYEKARLIGARALQISMGAPFVVKLSQEQLKELRYDPVKIAMKEFENDVLPIEIKRVYPDTRKKLDKDLNKEDKE
ncbi:MAG: DNA-directed RNA polymerase subunit K [Candidatus Woesearchaeota archaeon]